MFARLRQAIMNCLPNHIKQATELEPQPGRETRHLRLAFLAPLSGILLLLSGIWVLALYHHEIDMVDMEADRAQLLMARMYRDDVTHHANTLEAVMEVIRHDRALRTAFARRDRVTLLEHAAVYYPNLRQQFGITHFYFTTPDRVNLLRVHQPKRHGDRIDRFTTLEAVRTGQTARGVELGPLGTLTLRVVMPWYEQGHLLGYVELGIEIDRILQTMQSFTHMPLFVLIAKDFLKREDWESGMRMLGRNPEWDRFPHAVLSIQASDALPEALAHRLAQGLPPASSPALTTEQASSAYRAVFLPLHDAAGRQVAGMVGLVDVSSHMAASRRIIYLGSAAGVIAVTLLFIFFYRQVGRIGQRIEHYERSLFDIATHDRLTGAWNRRRFDELLNLEMERARRYGHPLSLIMFDIDHFKRVNDNFGHQAGDDLLAALAVYLSAHIRDSDILARWGGEEFMLITPDTDIESAHNLAEKLRVLVECGNFGEVGRITCSFGVVPFHADDAADDFTGRADAAMYHAKQSGRNRVCRVPPIKT